MRAILVLLPVLCACAALEQVGKGIDSGITYRAKGTFAAKTTDVGKAYYLHLEEPTFVRWIRLDTIDEIKFINVSVLVHNDWVLVARLDRPIAPGNRIHINRRARAVRVTQPSRRHDRLDTINNIHVFVQNKEASADRKTDE